MTTIITIVHNSLFVTGTVNGECYKDRGQQQWETYSECKMLC